MTETQVRYIHNKTEPLLREPDPLRQMSISLTRIVTNSPPKTPWTDGFKSKPIGLWTGPTAIAYAFLWVSRFHPELSINGDTPIQWCMKYLDCGSEEITSPKGLNGWGVKNEYLAYNAVKAAATQDTRYVDKFTSALANDFECPDVDNEHLSGRAGTLSLIRIIKFFVPNAAEQVSKFISPLIEHILGATPWTFSGHRYIGAAHGDIGILTQVVLSDHGMGRNQTVETELSALLDVQEPDGHWYITPPRKYELDMVHFCHGSPGFVISLLAIRPFVTSELQARINDAVKLGRQEVWEKGLLRKQPNLCHGITGNMMALETQEQKEHFMAHTTAEQMDERIKTGEFIKGDDQDGLQWGEAGRAWGWLMMESGQDLGWPGYTDV